MEKYKLIVMLTCHENKESLKDSIENILKFNENVCILVNDGTNENLEDLNNENVHIIKRKVPFSRFDTMVPLHIELKDYMIEKNIISDYVVLLSSNQLFIKKHLYDFIRSFDASYFEREMDSGCITQLLRHEAFKKCYNELGKDNFKYQSNHDGMFFTYEIFNNMMNFFDGFRGLKIDFHGEEFLYVAYLMKNMSIEKLAKFEKYNYWQPEWRRTLDPIKLDELKRCIENNYYIIKRVSRDINNEVRKFVREME